MLRPRTSKPASKSSTYQPDLISKLPPKLKSAIKKISQRYLGVMFSFRSNSATPSYDDEGAPKPPSFKVKTTKSGAAEGYILVEDKTTDESLSKLPQIQLQRPLDYFSKYELMDKKPIGGKLRFKSRDKDHTRIYCINVVNLKPTSSSQSDEHKKASASVGSSTRTISTTLHSVSNKESFLPLWWNESWGDWNVLKNQRFPVFFEGLNSKLQPLMVYALEKPSSGDSKDNKETKGTKAVPIISDWDLLWIAIPKELKVSDEAFKMLDTHKPSDEEEMYKSLKKLDMELQHLRGGDLPLDEKSMDKSFIQTLGNVTPLEVYLILKVNAAYSKEQNLIKNPIQHGPENRTPFKSTALSNIIHIGPTFNLSTESEEDLTKFMQLFGEKYRIELHSNWNINVWRHVFEALIKSHGTETQSPKVIRAFEELPDDLPPLQLSQSSQAQQSTTTNSTALTKTVTG